MTPERTSPRASDESGSSDTKTRSDNAATSAEAIEEPRTRTDVNREREDVQKETQEKVEYVISSEDTGAEDDIQPLGEGESQVVFPTRKTWFVEKRNKRLYPGEYEKALEQQKLLLALQTTLARPEFLGKNEARDMIIAQKVVRSHNPEMKEKWTTYQRLVPELQMHPWQFQAEYMEDIFADSFTGKESSKKAEIMKKTYKEINNALLVNTSGRDGYQQFLELQNNDNIRNIARLAEVNAFSKIYLTNLIRGMMTFSTETGEIFDTAGKNNIVLFDRENGDLTSRFVDPLYRQRLCIPQTRDILLRMQQGEEIGIQEAYTVQNAMNYARVMNALAQYLGIDERIDILPDELKKPGTEISFERLFQYVPEYNPKLYKHAA